MKHTETRKQNDLEVLIANVLDIWAELDPKRIFVKPKLHLLLHLLFDIRDHGPAGLYATEIFECFNAIFRMCSVLSNHQAPSRDIALACSDMDRFKHQVSGGWWRIDGSQFVQAGEAVRKYFETADLQRRLGYVSHTSPQPGKQSLDVAPYTACSERLAQRNCSSEEIERNGPRMVSFH